MDRSNSNIRKLIPFAMAMTIAVLLGFGCFLSPSDGDGGGGDGNGNEPANKDSLRTTPEDLINEYFVDMYERQDSTGYDAMLNSKYEFENLPDDVDPNTPGEIWFKVSEMLITGRMFSGWETGGGIRVLDITISFPTLQKVPSTSNFPDQPEDEEWFKMITTVDLVVVTADQSADDGSGIINRIVLAEQDFIVRPDVSDGGLWTIRKQFDKESITKR